MKHFQGPPSRELMRESNDTDLGSEKCEEEANEEMPFPDTFGNLNS